MSNDTRVTKVTIIVEVANGDLFKSVQHDPDPHGSNPRFIWQQVESGLDALTRRMSDTIQGTYGPQIEE